MNSLINNKKSRSDNKGRDVKYEKAVCEVSILLRKTHDIIDCDRNRLASREHIRVTVKLFSACS